MTPPTPGPHEISQGGRVRRAITARPWLFAVGFGLVAIPASRSCFRFDPPAPPIFGQLPDFALTDHHGKGISLADLAGQVWVASFVYTRDATGAGSTRHMQELSQRFTDAKVPVQMLTFSVDPTHDTPEVLADYAATAGVQSSKWRFITGPTDAVHHLVREGFLTHIDTLGSLDGVPQFSHSEKLVLVDGFGNLRGYYPSASTGPRADQVVDEVFWRAQHVLSEQEALQ